MKETSDVYEVGWNRRVLTMNVIAGILVLPLVLLSALALKGGFALLLGFLAGGIGLELILVILRRRSRKPLLRADAEGLWLFSARERGTIPWDGIADISLRGAHLRKRLIVRLGRPGSRPGALSRLTDRHTVDERLIFADRPAREIAQELIGRRTAAVEASVQRQREDG